MPFSVVLCAEMLSAVQCARCAPSPTKPGLARVSQYCAQVGQARLAVGEGWGGGWCDEAPGCHVSGPPPLTPPQSKSDISDFDHSTCRTRVNPSSGGEGNRPRRVATSL